MWTEGLPRNQMRKGDAPPDRWRLGEALPLSPSSVGVGLVCVDIGNGEGGVVQSEMVGEDKVCTEASDMRPIAIDEREAGRGRETRPTAPLYQR